MAPEVTNVGIGESAARSLAPLGQRAERGFAEVPQCTAVDVLVGTVEEVVEDRELRAFAEVVDGHGGHGDPSGLRATSRGAMSAVLPERRARRSRRQGEATVAQLQKRKSR